MTKQTKPWYLIFLSLFILIVLLTPGAQVPKLPETWFGVDKIAHLLIFFVWSGVFFADVGISVHRGVRVFFLSGIGFALLTEFLQLFAEGRSADLVDIVFDLIGLSLAFFLRNQIVRPFALLPGINKQ